MARSSQAGRPKPTYTLRVTLRKDQPGHYDQYDKLLEDSINMELLDSTLKGSDLESIAGRMASMIESTVEFETETEGD